MAWFWNHKKHQYTYIHMCIYVVIRSGLTLETFKKHEYIHIYTYIYVVIRSGLTLETLEKHM